MENKQNRNENLPDMESDILSKINRNTVFRTPENYFENLPVIIADRIHEGHTAIPAHGWSPVKIVTLAGFALIAIIAGATYYVGKNTEKRLDPVLSYEQVLNSGAVTELDETMLYEELDSRIPTADEVAQIQNIEENDHLKEYLMENNTDITLIINEL